LESLRKKVPVNNIHEKFDKIRQAFAAKTRADLLSCGIEIIDSEAEILGTMSDKNHGNNFVLRADGKIFESKYLIIANGSVPKDTGIAFPTNENEIPESVSIIGGGIAGLEAAEIFNTLGSKVNIYEISDKLCANLSQNAMKILVSKMKKNGIIFNNNVSECDFPQSTPKYFANGRKFSEIFGLENLGITITEHGIATNEYCETEAKNVFAIGDINGKSMLAHTASTEAFTAINKIMNKNIPVEYEKIPMVLYTNPSVARVGILPESNEQYEVRQMPLSGNGKWRAETETGERGLCEAVIERKNGRVAGLHLISPAADEIISTAAIIVQQNLTVDDVRKLVLPHPTISEILRETILLS
jgi:dihydrolipoamide dehydrogenase